MKHALDALMVLAWLGIVAMLGFYFHLERHSPSAPDSVTGQIAEMSDHGYLFYVRPWERLAFNLSGPAFAAAAAVVRHVRVKLYGDAGIKNRSPIAAVILMLIVSGCWIYLAWPLW